MRFELAPDVEEKVREIVRKLSLQHIDLKHVKCVRSYGSKSRATARIWGFPKIWQKALGLQPHYVIEVIHEKFDELDEEMKTKTLIHEILHIPKTFSGGLRPHRYFGKKIDSRIVERLYKMLKMM